MALAVATGALAAVAVWAAVAEASCENMLEARSRELRFQYWDVYPTGGAEESVMWRGFARGLATAVSCQRRIEADPALKALLRRSPIWLMMSADHRIRPQSSEDRRAPVPSDSVLSLFRGVDSESVAVMFSIQLASFRTRTAAARGVARFPALERLRGRIEWDGTAMLDLNHGDCSVGDGDRPSLFILPPGGGRGRGWGLFSGLYMSRSDAERGLRTIPHRQRVTARVVPLIATGKVLAAVFPPR